MRTIPTSIPSALTAGDSWQWDDPDFSDYPHADGWVLEYVLVGATQVAIAGAKVEYVGGKWQIRVPAADTAALASGTYRFAAYATKGTDRFEARRGTVLVQANLSTMTDGRTVAEKDLAVLDAAISGRLSQDLQSYQINGRAVVKIPIEELLKIRGRLRSQVWRERNPGKLGPTVKVTFG